MRILLTGNSSGIGLAVENELEALGHRVMGTHRLHGITNVRWQRLWDLSNAEDIQAVGDEYGPIDVLINNAGILDHEPFGQLTVAGIEKVFRVNVVAPLLLAQEAVGAGAKLIINIGSGWGITGSYGVKPVYAASKAALHNITLSLSRMLGPAVRVVGIAPGLIETGIHNSVKSTALNNCDYVSLKRHGTPVEIAKLVRFVVEEGTYLNGTILECTGGR